MATAAQQFIPLPSSSAEHDAPADDHHAQGPDKGPPLDTTLVEYLKRMHAHLELLLLQQDHPRHGTGTQNAHHGKGNQDQDTQHEINMLVRSIHAEIKARGYRLAVNARCSTILELVLDQSSHYQLRFFLAQLRGLLIPLITDRCASHVIQHVLKHAPAILLAEYKLHKRPQQQQKEQQCTSAGDGVQHENTNYLQEDSKAIDNTSDLMLDDENLDDDRDTLTPEPPSFRELLLDLCSEMQPQWLDMFVDPHASHIVRDILTIISGGVPGSQDNHQQRAQAHHTPRNRHYGEIHSGGGAAAANGGDSHGDPLHGKTAGQKRKHLKGLTTSILSSMVAAIDPSMCTDADVSYLWSHAQGSPVLQALLEACGTRGTNKARNLQAHVIARLLCWMSPNSAEEEEEAEANAKQRRGEDEEEGAVAPTAPTTSLLRNTSVDKWEVTEASKGFVYKAMGNRSGSRMLEAILRLCDDSVFTRISEAYFEGQLPDLATHSIANYCVQSYLLHIRSKEMAQAAVDALLRGSETEGRGQGGSTSGFVRLVECRRGGVIHRACQACVRWKICSPTILKAIGEAVNVSDMTNDLSFVEALLYFDKGGQEYDSKHGVGEETDEGNASSGRARDKRRPAKRSVYSVIGSLILQAILQFPERIVKPVVRSFGSLSPSFLRSLALDAGGSRVLEAFFSSLSVPLKDKRAMTAKFVTKIESGAASAIPALADSLCGRFVLNQCFDAADLSMRAAIAKELAGSERRLLGSRGGQSLLRRYRIALFVRDVHQWRRGMQQWSAVQVKGKHSGHMRGMAREGSGGGCRVHHQRGSGSDGTADVNRSMGATRGYDGMRGSFLCHRCRQEGHRAKHCPRFAAGNRPRRRPLPSSSSGGDGGSSVQQQQHGGDSKRQRT